MKLLVIGVDGFSHRMVEKTKDSFMAGLMEKSQHGLSKSVITKYSDMPLTGPNWASVYTGAGPDEHRVNDEGWRLDNQKYEDICVNTIFEEIDKKYSLCLMTMPLTFPAFKVNGWMISGFPTPNSLDNCYYPSEIGDFLDDDFMISYEKCALGLKWSEIEDRDEKVRLGEIFRKLAFDHVNVFKNIYSEKNTDVGFIGLTYIDRMNHMFLQSDPEMKKAYLDVFSIIKDLVMFFDPENVVICSDHGFRPDKCDHDMDGFYLFNSEGFSGRKDISIKEVAPTILKILGICSSLGKPVKREKKELDEKGEAEIRKRLEALGYI